MHPTGGGSVTVWSSDENLALVCTISLAMFNEIDFSLAVGLRARAFDPANIRRREAEC